MLFSAFTKKLVLLFLNLYPQILLSEKNIKMTSWNHIYILQLQSLYVFWIATKFSEESSYKWMWTGNFISQFIAYIFLTLLNHTFWGWSFWYFADAASFSWLSSDTWLYVKFKKVSGFYSIFCEWRSEWMQQVHQQKFWKHLLTVLQCWSFLWLNVN